MAKEVDLGRHNDVIILFGQKNFANVYVVLAYSMFLPFFYLSFVSVLLLGIVNKSLVISPTSEFFHLWKDPPVDPGIDSLLIPYEIDGKIH